MDSWIQKSDHWLPRPNKRKSVQVTEPPAQEQEQDQLPQYGVIYHVLRCPKCKSKNIRTHTTELPIRYHKCRDCGYNFKSREATDDV
jgi:predicted Zn-ribbon and HTH transcriptional regulator